MAERRAKPDSPCDYGRPGQYHNWFVYAHTPNWRILKCFCSRCAVRCTMSQHDYEAVLDAAEREWQAFVARNSTHRGASDANVWLGEI